MSRHCHFSYGISRVLWSCTVFVIHGTMASLENAATAVEINVYSATRNHLLHESIATPKSLVFALGPKLKNLLSSSIMTYTKKEEDIIVQIKIRQMIIRFSLKTRSKRLESIAVSVLTVYTNQYPLCFSVVHAHISSPPTVRKLIICALPGVLATRPNSPLKFTSVGIPDPRDLRIAWRDGRTPGRHIKVHFHRGSRAALKPTSLKPTTRNRITG